jgi:transcription antitermination factor NusG
MQTSEAKWFALQVQPLKERLVATILADKGYEQFLPIWRPKGMPSTRNSGYALFPGYVFCRIDLNPSHSGHAPVVTTPGFLRIVGYGRTPQAVPDWEMENLRRVTSIPGIWDSENQLHTGSPVRICHGLLTGVEGVLIDRRGKGRVVVQVTLLGGGASVEVEETQIRPAHANGRTLASVLGPGQLVAFYTPDINSTIN